MATVLTGAVITNDQRSSISYKDKCERCGNTQGGYNTPKLNRGSNHTRFFRCQKCGNDQKVHIKFD